jgi:hypothetical protein
VNINLGPRMRIWQESNPQRIVMTSDGPIVAYEGQWVLVVVGKSLEDCVKQFCPMLRGEESE